MEIPAVRPEVKSAAVLACLAALALAYFSNTPIPGSLTRLKEIGLAGILLWSAGGFGTRLLQLSKVSGLTDGEVGLFAIPLGMGVLSFLMILLGVFGAWVPAGAWVLVVGGLSLSGSFLRSFNLFLSAKPLNTPLPNGSFGAILALTIGCALSFLLALTPITYYDSLVYHLALPAVYIQAHRWVALPGLIYSAFPQTLEMLWTLSLLIGDDVVANLMGWAMGLLLLGAIVAYGRRFFNYKSGLTAAALIAVMPAFLLLTSGGYVDVGLTLFGFLSFYAISLWRKQPAGGFLVIAGLFAGWAAGTKYTGALPGLILALFLAVWLRQERSALVPSLLRYGGAALAVFSPWLIKNTLYVGNPIFPFFYNWGLRDLNPWLNQAAAGYFYGITEYYSRSFLELPAVLWQAAVNGIGFGRGIDVLGDFGWLPLLGFLPALWLCRKMSSSAKLLLVFCSLFFIPWAMSHPVLRFLLPIGPLLALITAYIWEDGIRPQRPAVRWIARGFMASFLLSGLFIFSYVTGLLSSFAVPLGLESRDAYLTRKLNYYAAAQFLDTRTPADSYIYIVGDQRGYYYNRHTWISPAFSRNPLMEWANASKTSRDLKQKLKQEGITHILVNNAEYERLKTYHFARFDEQGQRHWDALRSGALTLLYRDPACDVYGL